MKKFILPIISFCVIATILTGCGTLKKKVTEKASEEAGEKFLESILGNDADVEKDKDGGIKISGKDGEELSLGSKKWPESEAAKQIPEFKKGTLTSVSTINDSSFITISEVKQSDFESYKEKVIAAGFDEEATNMEMDESLMYSGAKDKAKYVVIVTYHITEGEMTITIAKSEEDLSENNNNSEDEE